MKVPNEQAKRDCFAYSGGHYAHDRGCRILTKMLCEKGKCPFYKKEGNKCK